MKMNLWLLSTANSMEVTHAFHQRAPPLIQHPIVVCLVSSSSSSFLSGQPRFLPGEQEWGFAANIPDPDMIFQTGNNAPPQMYDFITTLPDPSDHAHVTLSIRETRQDSNMRQEHL